MPTTMIRIDQATHKKLRALVSRTGGTMAQLIATAVEEYERKLFWEQVTLEFSVLRENPKAWKRELEERSAWDVTLSDGLEE